LFALLVSKEGLQLGDGRAAVLVVVGGFDVEAVDGEGEFTVCDRGCEGHCDGVTVRLGWGATVWLVGWVVMIGVWVVVGDAGHVILGSF